MLNEIKKEFDEGGSYRLNWEQIDWLIIQAEKVEQLEDLLIEADAVKTCQAVEISGLKDKIEQLERNAQEYLAKKLEKAKLTKGGYLE